MNPRQTRPITPLSKRLRKVLVVALVGCAILGLVYGVAPKIFTGDFADVKIESITAAPNGKITVRIVSVVSHGTPFLVQLFRDKVYVDGTRDESTGGVLQRPVERGQSVSFNLDPEGKSATGSFEDSPLFKRLLIRAGAVYHLHGDETLKLFDFQASDGVRYTGFIRVARSLSAI